MPPHPSILLVRQPSLPSLSSQSSKRTFSSTSSQRAQLLRRPHRPYQFTALISHSDGSVSFTRTTSPQPLYKSQKDIRNHALWNPSSQKLANAEQDDAGRLRAFRNRFGRGWDGETRTEEDEVEHRPDSTAGSAGQESEVRAEGDSGMDSLMDLISPGYNQPNMEEKEPVGGKAKGKKK